MSGAIVAIASYWCGPAYAACVAGGNYEIARAYGANTIDALRAGALAGVSAYAFGPTNPSGIGFKQAALMFAGDMIAAQNPAFGQIYNVVAGSMQGGFSFQNLVGQSEKYLAGRALERVALNNGLTLQELNLLLAANSRLGLELAGTTYNDKTHDVGGFFSRKGGSFFEKGSFAGAFWDINDSLLNSQGLLDAVSRTIVKSGYSGGMEGHSLGAWRVNNLFSHGFIDGATTMSLPFFAYPVTGSQSWCINTDPVCGGAPVTAFRSGAAPLSAPDHLINSHDWVQYKEKAQ